MFRVGNYRTEGRPPCVGGIVIHRVQGKTLRSSRRNYMAKTAAERQATYRQKSDQFRLNTYLNNDAKEALEAISRYTKLTQKEVLECLIINYKNHLVKQLNEEQLDLFYDQTP